MDYWELTTCWNYFLSLDRDLNETARYIEPESQENTFSFEFYKIIMLGCAEIETAFKQVCKAIDSSKKSGSIDKYKEMILSRYPKIEDCEVVVRRWHSRAIRPFEGWSQGPLFWWNAFYFYLNKSGMSKPEYEAFVNELYREGLVKIDLHGCGNFDDATVSATNAAVAYIENAGRPKIGF